MKLQETAEICRQTNILWWYRGIMMCNMNIDRDSDANDLHVPSASWPQPTTPASTAQPMNICRYA